MRTENETIFDRYLEGQTRRIFKNERHYLRAEYIPEYLPHRDEEISQLAGILSTALKGERPSNILIFGKTGTGKTACAKYIGKELRRKVETDERAKKVNYVYINCKVVDTEYGVLAAIGNNFTRTDDEKIPFTGWPMEKVYNHLKDRIEAAKGVTLIILDEIDQHVYKSGGNVLYLLTNLNDEMQGAKVSIIGITNDSKFTDHLEMRIKTRLGEEKVVFPPYNADELKDILVQRLIWLSRRARSSPRSYHSVRPSRLRSMVTPGGLWTCSGWQVRSRRGNVPRSSLRDTSTRPRTR